MLRDIPFPIQQLQQLQPSADSSMRSVVLQDNDMLHGKRLSANTQEKKLRERVGVSIQSVYPAELYGSHTSCISLARLACQFALRRTQRVNERAYDS